jgi:hypothetical protein
VDGLRNEINYDEKKINTGKTCRRLQGYPDGIADIRKINGENNRQRARGFRPRQMQNRWRACGAGYV